MMANCEAFAPPPAYQPAHVWANVWQVVSKSKPNKAHYALAALERRCRQEGKRLTLITQVGLRTHLICMHLFGLVLPTQIAAYQFSQCARHIIAIIPHLGAC